MFAPAFTGQISQKSPKVVFEANCFEETSLEFIYDSATPDEATVIVTLDKPRDLTCSDWYLFGNTEIQHVEEFFTKGTHTLKFKAADNKDKQSAIVDLAANGFETYLFCESLKDELLSVLTSLKAFVGGLGMHGRIPLFGPKVPEYMEKANLDFLKWALNIEFEERQTQKVIIDESEI